MPTEIILNNTSYIIPDAGDQNYAEELTAYLIELSKVLGTVQGSLDIIKTTFNFQNNISSPANVTGFIFPTGSVARFEARYTITRKTAVIESQESGKLTGTQGNGGWILSRHEVQSQNGQFDSLIGIEFDITSGGQITYTSTDLPGQTEGTITFVANTIEE